MLEPIISKIANTMMKAVAYINVFIKALTGVDFIAKAIQKSLNGANKSSKALSKTLAGFDELTNLDTTTDTSWTNAFNNIELNPKVTEVMEGLASKVNKLKQAWDELEPSMKNVIKGLGIAGILGILTGKPGLILGISAVILGIDGLCKIFDKDLTTSVEGLIELLGMAGLIGILTGDVGLAGAIAGVVLALAGLNEMINGDTGDAIEGLMLLIGGSGLTGALIGGLNGFSLGVAIASVISILKGFNEMINGDTTDTVKGFIELVIGTAGLVVAINLIRGGAKTGLLGLITPLSLVAIGFVAFASGVALVIKNWENMNTLQRVISILGLIAIGAATAAAAVGALQSAWSLGIAAAAIVAGTAAIAASVAAASKKAKENLPSYDVGTNYVPEDQLAYIHKGEAVVPKKFNSQEYFGSGNEETNSLLQELIERVENIEINPYTTVKDVGQASVKYINSTRRRLGRSVV